MRTYEFLLRNFGSIRVDAANRLAAMMMFEEMGFNPAEVTSIRVVG